MVIRLQRLVLATANQGKKRELQALLAGSGVEVHSLADYPGLVLPAEDGVTFQENARLKAAAVAAAVGAWALSDDSGLEVDFLAGAPGVRSARYAGLEADDQANNRRLLAALSGVPAAGRGAAFVCVLALISPDGDEFFFSGRCRGRIASQARGGGGFGYDPVFLAEPDFRRTMAELEAGEKNRISHRGRALRQLSDWLNQGCPPG
ncbi:MAG: XTP/dITP diphosphatase [Deltaproteobacteria bacterium]|nr:XTP/dITP diphosphatase [Deltaproteobacteria bacterium]